MGTRTPRRQTPRPPRPMTFPVTRGRSVQMGNSTTTCGGPKTLLPSDDKPGRGCDSDRMSAQAAISVDANAIDPIAALKRVGGVRHNTHMRKIGIATAMVAVAVALAIRSPGVIHKFGDALLRALPADPGWVRAGVGFELASFVGYIALFW